MRISGSFRLLAAAAALAAAVAAQAGAQRPAWAPDPIPPPPREATWLPSPGVWERIESAVLRDAQGDEWRISVERRLLGGLRNRAVDEPVYFPRAIFERIHGKDTIAIAVLLPTDNADVAIFPPNDPEVSAVPSQAAEDTWGRWPNPCSFTIVDATGRLDIDSGGRTEVAIGRMCACPSIACSGIVFVRIGPDGASVLDPSRLVRDVAIGRISVREMIASSDSSRPVLSVEPEILDDCRFIALAGVRGRTDCKDCCTFPVLLRPTFGGEYQVFYDYTRQQAWKNKMNDLIGYVAAGDLQAPPTSDEEARLAQAAAFFYLTGSGSRTHQGVNDALGQRAHNFHLQEVLNRMDRIFLPDTSGAPGPRNVR